MGYGVHGCLAHLTGGSGRTVCSLMTGRASGGVAIPGSGFGGSGFGGSGFYP